MTDTKIPVITIDGPGGTGKGTASAALAQRLGWHWLDSGSIYRAMAWVVLTEGNPELSEAEIVELVSRADIAVGSTLDESGCSQPWVRVAGQQLHDEIRTELCSQMASKIASISAIRDLVLDYQRSFAQLPGLVTDGRDMGTVVFPDAALKIFLVASPEVRAKRRQKQLQKKGVSVSLASVLEEINERDARDCSRSVAPAVAAEDAIVIDTSQLRIDETLQSIWRCVEEHGLVSNLG